MENAEYTLNPLSQLQAKINCPKRQYNKFGEYYYRSLEDIFEALKPYLQELNLFLQLSDEIVLVGDRYYVCATASLCDFSGMVIATSKGWAREELEKKKSDASQLTGMASSYARKYALSALLCLDDIKDADTTTPDQPSNTEKVGGYKYDLRKLGDRDTIANAVEYFKKNGVEAVMGKDNEIIITLEKPLSRLKACEVK